MLEEESVKGEKKWKQIRVGWVVLNDACFENGPVAYLV